MVTTWSMALQAAMLSSVNPLERAHHSPLIILLESSGIESLWTTFGSCVHLYKQLLWPRD